MFELEGIHIIMAVISAVLIGLSKTGLPALGILVVAVMASIFPARESIGIVLPLLITADIIAVIYYRKSVNWKTLFSLIPWVLGGLAAGFIFLYFFTSSRPVEVVLGIIIVLMICLQFFKEKQGAPLPGMLPASIWFIAVMGTLAGFTTMVGNAAGPVMSIFLIALSLPKKEFIGTGAWFFLSVNLIKVPMYGSLGLITTQTLIINMWLVPAILTGTYLGIKFLPFIPQKKFNMIILILSLAGGIMLLIG